MLPFFLFTMNILITGASRGIGASTAKSLARKIDKGFFFLLARDAEKLNQVALDVIDLNKNIVPVPISIDLSCFDPNKVNDIISGYTDTIDAVINNAALLIKKSFFDFTEKELIKIYSSNVISIFQISKLSKVYLLNSKEPRIINISSVGGLERTNKFAGLSAYSSSKAAVTILTECMAKELKDFGIKVNCLAFGAVQTDMLEDAFPNYTAPISPNSLAEYVSDFCLFGHNFHSGCIISVSFNDL